MPLRIEHYDPRDRDQDSDYDDDNDSYYSEPRHESSSTDSDYETDDDFFDDEGNFRPRQHVFEERPLRPISNLDDIEIVNGETVFKIPIIDKSLQPLVGFFPNFIDYADIQSGKYFADLEKQKQVSILNQEEKNQTIEIEQVPIIWNVTSSQNNTPIDLSVIQKQEQEEEKNKEERRRRPPPSFSTQPRPPPSPQNFRSKGPPRSLLRPNSNPTPSPRHMNHRDERPKTRLLSNPQSTRALPPSPVQVPTPPTRTQPQPSPTPSIHKKTNRKIDMLCAYRSGHDSQCRLTHDLDSWRPRICKFKESCNKIKHCSFWHSEKETKKEYIQRSFSLRDSHFAKLSKEYKELYL